MGEPWQSQQVSVGVDLVKDVRKGLAKRTFGDRGADAAVVVHDAVVMAVNPQIGHAVRSLWEPAHRREEREDRDRVDVGVEGSSDRERRSAAAARSGAAWAGAGLVLALVPVALFGQSALVGSDAFILPGWAAIVLSAAMMLVSFGCLYRYERGVATGTMQRWDLLPERHLLVAVILYALACVLAVFRIFRDAGDVSVIGAIAFVLQLAVLAGSIALLAGRGGTPSTAATGAVTTRSRGAGAGEKNSSARRGSNATDIDAVASSARAKEEALLERLTPIEQETIVAVQLHVLRDLLLADRLTRRGAAEAIATVRERWGDGYRRQ